MGYKKIEQYDEDTTNELKKATVKYWACCKKILKGKAIENAGTIGEGNAIHDAGISIGCPCHPGFCEIP